MDPKLCDGDAGRRKGFFDYSSDSPSRNSFIVGPPQKTFCVVAKYSGCYRLFLKSLVAEESSKMGLAN